MPSSESKRGNAERFQRRTNESNFTEIAGKTPLEKVLSAPKPLAYISGAQSSG
jgi:hypothetical protein